MNETVRVEKIRVSAAIADALKVLTNVPRHTFEKNLEDIFKIHQRGWASHAYKPLNDLSMSELATALLVGYEVENKTFEGNEYDFAVEFDNLMEILSHMETALEIMALLEILEMFSELGIDVSVEKTNKRGMN